MADLIIDQGNSATKIWIFENDQILDFKIFDNQKIKSIISELTALISSYSIQWAIYSTVSNPIYELIDFLDKKLNLLFLKSTTPVPIEIDYDTIETLGVDRIADAVGAWTLFPSQNLLVVDIGTAITIDIVTKEGKFIGGNISPGPQMRLNALHHFTAKLPKLKLSETNKMLGKSTKEAMLNGVIYGIVFEICGYLDYLRGNFENLRAIITGGFSSFFEKKFKCSIFVQNDLIALGLNRILQFNKR